MDGDLAGTGVQDRGGRGLVPSHINQVLAVQPRDQQALGPPLHAHPVLTRPDHSRPHVLYARRHCQGLADCSQQMPAQDLVVEVVAFSLGHLAQRRAAGRRYRRRMFRDDVEPRRRDDDGEAVAIELKGRAGALEPLLQGGQHGVGVVFD